MSDQELKDILQIAGDDFEAMLHLATENYSDGKFSETRAILAGLIAINDADARLYKLLGSCLLLEDRHRDAEKAYEKAYGLDQQDPYTLVALGEIKLKSLNLSEAVPLFEKLFALDPDGEHPAANRGRRLVQEHYQKLSS